MTLKWHHTDRHLTIHNTGLSETTITKGKMGVRGEEVRTGDSGWNVPHTPFNSPGLDGDSRLKQKPISHGCLGNTSLEVSSILEKVWSDLKTDVTPKRTAFQTSPPCGHLLPNLLPTQSPIWETEHSLQPRLPDEKVFLRLFRLFKYGCSS